MRKPSLMHLFTSEPQASPFDVNMAYDGGFEAVTPYVNVALEQVHALTQDAIFSRGPRGARRTAIRIGGRDLGLALKMFDAARKAMVPPFEVSVFVDPSGAFTTAAALIAKVQQGLWNQFSGSLENCRVLIYGGSGPVGIAAATIAALQKAKVTILDFQTLDRAQAGQKLIEERYGVKVDIGLFTDKAAMPALLGEANVILATAKAGVQVVSREDLMSARKLYVAADVNAVPPAGIEGVGVMDDGRVIEGTAHGALAYGALAIGNVKYQTESQLCVRMADADKPLYLDFIAAFDQAQEIVSRRRTDPPKADLAGQQAPGAAMTEGHTASWSGTAKRADGGSEGSGTKE